MRSTTPPASCPEADRARIENPCRRWTEPGVIRRGAGRPSGRSSPAPNRQGAYRPAGLAIAQTHRSESASRLSRLRPPRFLPFLLKLGTDPLECAWRFRRASSTPRHDHLTSRLGFRQRNDPADSEVDRNLNCGGGAGR